jgi:hypothetical protein
VVSDPYQSPRVGRQRPLVALATEQADLLRAALLRQEGHLQGAGMFWPE